MGKSHQSKPLPHVRFFLFLERKPLALGLCLVFIILMLLTLFTVRGDKDGMGSDPKLTVPPGTIIRCPPHREFVIQECHSELVPSGEIPWGMPGLYVLQFG
jgi:hypothetical protein